MTNTQVNILPFYDALEFQHHLKSYAYGKISPVLCPVNRLPSFQIVVPSDASIVETKLVNYHTGTETVVTLLGLQSQSVNGYKLYSYPATSDLFQSFLPGTYYLIFEHSGQTLYSDLLTMCDDTSQLLKIEYWHNENFVFPNGLFSYSGNFKNIAYFNTETGKNQYGYEEKVSERNGYNFILHQSSWKEYVFELILTEEQIDFLRLIQLHDNIKVSSQGTSLDVQQFSFNAEWQEQGDLAIVECRIRGGVVSVSAQNNVIEVDDTGTCFLCDYIAITKIEKDSAEHDGFFYDNNGSSTNFQDLDYVLIEENGLIELYQYEDSAYTLISTDADTYVADIDNDKYYEHKGSEKFKSNEYISVNASKMKGYALKGTTIEIHVKLDDDTVFLAGTGNNIAFERDGIDFAYLDGSVQAKLKTYNSKCGLYDETEFFKLPFPCAIDLYDVEEFASDEIAIASGVEDGQFYILAIDNVYGMVRGLLKKINPNTSQMYASDEAAFAGMEKKDRCYITSKDNVFGVPSGLLKIVVDTKTTYVSDTQATSDGLKNNEFYPVGKGNAFGLDSGFYKRLYTA